MSDVQRALAVDTSTELMAVAVRGADGTTRLEAERGLQHGAELGPAVAAAMSAAGVAAGELELIVVGVGPGSFTGVRIGLATAQGLAAPNRVPVAGVSGLDALGWRHRPYPGLVVPTIDGRKQRVYSALYRAGERTGEYLDLSASDLVAAVATAAQGTPAGVPPMLCGPAAGLVRAAAAEATSSWYVDSSTGGAVIPIGELLELGMVRGGERANAVHPLYLRKSEAELGIRS